VVVELYIKFGLIYVIVTEITYAYAPEVHLMTSRELTSGFDFWSCGHLRMAVVHLLTTFGVDTCIQSRVIDIYQKFQMVAAAIFDFQFM